MTAKSPFLVVIVLICAAACSTAPSQDSHALRWYSGIVTQDGRLHYSEVPSAVEIAPGSTSGTWTLTFNFQVEAFLAGPTGSLPTTPADLSCPTPVVASGINYKSARTVVITLMCTNGPQITPNYPSGTYTLSPALSGFSFMVAARP